MFLLIWLCYRIIVILIKGFFVGGIMIDIFEKEFLLFLYD